MVNMGMIGNNLNVPVKHCYRFYDKFDGEITSDRSTQFSSL